jgi:tRNA (guanine37-N1)-methyltransferase
MKEAAFRYLSQDVLKNIDMLEILHIPSAEVLRAGDFGVLLRYGDLYLLSCQEGASAAFLPAMTQDIASNPQPMIFLHGQELLGVLRRDYRFRSVMDCCHAVYQKSAPIPCPLPQNVKIRRLDSSHLAFVHAHYHTVDDVGYLSERIGAGMFGVFVEGRIVGFAGTHDERSMGLLEILPRVPEARPCLCAGSTYHQRSAEPQQNAVLPGFHSERTLPRAPAQAGVNDLRFRRSLLARERVHEQERR